MTNRTNFKPFQSNLEKNQKISPILKVDRKFRFGSTIGVYDIFFYVFNVFGMREQPTHLS